MTTQQPANVSRRSPVATETAYTVATPGGYPVPVTWHAGRAGAPVIVLLPALGVSVHFYDTLGVRLAETGFNVVLMEQRGQGVSRLRPARSRDWGFADILENDLPAVMAWARRRAEGAPLYLLGHSLGGHYGAMATGLYPDQIDGLVLVATGSPWLEAFEGAWQRKVRTLTRLIPVCNLLFGYFPGKRIGFGGNEARTVMADWRLLARTNRYSARGLSQDVDAGIAAYTGPVLVIAMADDDFAPEASVKAVAAKFERARVTGQRIDTAALGDRADHFRWARRPAVAVDAIRRWFDDLDPRGRPR